jgi:putative nucleotidyltransferase with HDIG domain
MHTRFGTTRTERTIAEATVDYAVEAEHVDVSALIEQLTELPAQPSAALRVLWLLDDPDCSLADLGKLIEADPALSARVMHLANSSFYGLAQQVSSALRAVTVLGQVTVRALAAVSAGGLLDTGSRTVPDGFWAHSTTCAAGASVVARRMRIAASEAFSAGLLHDIGVALLYRHAPEQYEGVLQFAAIDPDNRLAFERRVFGLDHAEAGAAALKAWRFPEVFVETVRSHHEPVGAPRAELARCVVAGEALAVHPTDDRGEPAHRVDHALAQVGIDVAELEGLVHAMETEAEALAAFLGWDA